MNVLGRRKGIRLMVELDPSVILILRSIFFLSFANVATFFNVAGTKLGFWTFAKT